ncbi:MAG: metalloregulator ArsR/SmtB family transcription factor [Dehalococcoidales bacterium]|nr:metalloregulator ArsR/SmtB family transcription factor [Dehalococcoidales bacterium]
MISDSDIELFRLKAELCKTFSDPRRLMIINELRRGEQAVGDLVKTLNTPQAVISRHLAVLRHRGVVANRRAGVNVYYRLANPKIIEACDIVHEVLMEQVASNKELAEKLL